MSQVTNTTQTEQVISIEIEKVLMNVRVNGRVVGTIEFTVDMNKKEVYIISNKKGLGYFNTYAEAVKALTGSITEQPFQRKADYV